MQSNPPVPEEKPRPVVLGMHFDAVTVPQALDRFFELAAMPPGPRGCRIAATVNVDFIVNTYCATKSTPRNPALARVLRRAELVIADLLIEYIDYAAFRRVIRQVCPRFVSCVIQINDDAREWVSDSPWLHAFDGLDAIHHRMEPAALSEKMAEIGYRTIAQTAAPLPNGKQLLRLDYVRCK